MDFLQFERYIASEINVYIKACFGLIGPGYLQVLMIYDNEIMSIGSIIYNAYRNEIATPEILIEFGKACEEFRLDLINGRIEKNTIPPSCHFNSDGKLQIFKYEN